MSFQTFSDEEKLFFIEFWVHWGTGMELKRLLAHIL